MAAYKLAPTDKGIRQGIADLKAAKAAAKAKDKAMFGGAFGKVSMYDEKRSPNAVIVPSANNPKVFFDMKQGDEDLGRIVMQVS